MKPNPEHYHKLLRGQARLAAEHPLMAPLILNLEFEPDPKVDIAATSEACTTYYNPAWASGITTPAQSANLEAVLYHEVLHLFLDYFGRRNTRDNFRWNVAHDLEISHEVKPVGCIKPADFGLPLGKVAESYYDSLPEHVKGSGAGCQHWMVSDQDGKMSAETQRAIIECAERIVQAKGIGTTPGMHRRALELVRPTHGDDRLRQIQGALLSAGNSDFSYERFNRRAGASQGGPILPALIHRDARIMCVLDVSGSMEGRTQPAAAALLGAVKCVGSGLDLIAWDTHMQSVCNVRTSKDLEKIRWSGGGTDMAAAIRYAAKRGRYDALFVITDCETAWPADSEAKRLPPIYILRIGQSGGIPSWCKVIQAG